MDGRRATDRIADDVLAWKPDIVCFQEVHQRLPWSKFVDQPGRLHRRLGMPFVFQANLRSLFAGYGLGIATHYPILAVTRRRLPSRGEIRGALQLELETPVGRLMVVCTHWGLNSQERVRQAAQIGQWLIDTPPPFVFCGDLNARPEAQEIQDLIQQVGLLDAGAAANSPTYPSDAPHARIDVILYSRGLCVKQVFTAVSQASDHFPVIADFESD